MHRQEEMLLSDLLRLPTWRNGRRAAFRSQSLHGGVGSNPIVGTNFLFLFLFFSVFSIGSVLLLLSCAVMCCNVYGGETFFTGQTAGKVFSFFCNSLTLQINTCQKKRKVFHSQ